VTTPLAPCPVCGALNAETARFCSTCGTELASRRIEEVRKVVTILFADVTGSTALGEQLDPEALRAIMARYFAMMKRVIERHGGTVEKFIGDAVMAVFGIPVVHEDDALRAVRAAAEVKAELAALNAELLADRGIAIRFRTGVNTGEVVAGDPTAAANLVTGDTVNTAARLEQNAPPDEVLLGRLTYQLVRDAVEAEAVEPIAAKGKALPVEAYRLVAVRPGAAGHSRRLDAPLVGRERELGRLRQAFADAVADRSCQLFTLLGTAGVGKSRLVTEFAATVGAEATVLRGRCLPYGEGITYWPIGELVRAAAGIDEADTAEDGRAKVRALLEGEREADLLAARVAAAIGLSTEPAPQEELFWAIRRLLEHLARERPTVVVVEDIHWAEPTLLDLLEHIADWSRDAPLLLLAPARPELLESRPGWGGGKLNATTILLEPLAAAATSQLIAALPGGAALPAAVVTRIETAAEGNPLFVEEFLAMLIDEGLLHPAADGGWTTAAGVADVAVPASISALLAARLEQLAPPERRVAERASVVGRVFETDAVSELADEALRPDVRASIMALVRKELVRPDRSELTAGEAFKFRHILIRDAAYEALPKAERASLHERFAGWLERTAGERATELEEITGYHLGQAHRYRVELGETGERVELLAERAATKLLSAGRRSLDRGDMPAAAEVLRRAADLLPAGDARRLERMPDIGFALFSIGSIEEALALLAAAASEAEKAGNESARIQARLEMARIDLVANGDRSGQWTEEARAAIPRLESLNDQVGLAKAWFLLAQLAWYSTTAAEAVAARERGARHADLAGESQLAQRVMFWGAEAYGAEPVSSALQRVEAARAEATTNPVVEAAALWNLTALYAMAGDIDRAREARELMTRRFRELGMGLWEAGCAEAGAIAELIGGQPEAAEALLRHAISSLEQLGARSPATILRAFLSVALSRRRQDAAALAVADQALAEAAGDDVGVLVQTAIARASSLARLGAVDEALAAGEEAVRLASQSDFLIDHGDAEVALSEALDAAGRSEDAKAARQRALEIYRRKGSIASEQRLTAAHAI
jgi:class 3 adenylate cyclase/tetratricopeptide (TPR) repeat protein